MTVKQLDEKDNDDDESDDAMWGCMKMMDEKMEKKETMKSTGERRKQNREKGGVGVAETMMTLIGNDNNFTLW